MNENLKVGAKVQWSSQAGGRTVKKCGEIICIVPAREQPFVLKADDQKLYTLPDGQKIPYGRTRYGGGIPRNEVSCIVRVPNPENPQAVESYYWPRVGDLKFEDAQNAI